MAIGETFECPVCHEEWDSPRAMMACEERCETEERAGRRIFRP